MDHLEIARGLTVICKCRAVNRKRIKKAIVDGNSTIKQLQTSTNAGTGCGKCIPKLITIINEELSLKTP